MMAWTVKVKASPATNRYRADAVRTDDITGAVESYWLEGILDKKLDKAGQVAVIRDNFWQQHEEAVAKVSAEAEAAGTLAKDLATALDARELKGVVRG